jgi:two-component system response regulator HydG
MLKMKRVLIIDDDPDICLLLERFLKRNDMQVSKAFSAAKGLEMLRKEVIDLVLCDFRLPDAEGMQVLQKIKTLKPAVAVIIITGYSDVKIAVKCIRLGAFDYVTKPIHPEEILITLNKAFESVSPLSRKEEQIVFVKPQKPAHQSTAFVQGVSPQSMQVKKSIALVAPTDMSVVVTGETGTGKEYVAKSIHQSSTRKDGAFMALDCGALPKEIAASELFGHKKGAFTGALADKMGAFESANGGTLFLDEVANLTYDNQVKLLRVLQERKIRRIGDTKDRKVDVRIIAATNENLWDKAQDGDFREDLFHRLNEFSIQLSPLRERPSEIEQFAHYFIENANKELNRSVDKIDSEALQDLKSHYWHGNLRELKNVIKRAVLMSESNEMGTAQLPFEIAHPTDDVLATGKISESTGLETLKEVVESAEKYAIIQALKKTEYNKSKTAALLDVDRKTLYNKIKAYDISLTR